MTVEPLVGEALAASIDRLGGHAGDSGWQLPQMYV